MLSTLPETAFSNISSHHSRSKSATLTAASTDCTKSRVLIVADESLDQMLLGELNRNGFHITEFDSSATADRMRLAKPDVVIHAADNAFNASQWCRAFRLNQMTVPIHIILPTVTPFDEALLLELGADWVGDDEIEPRLLASRLHALLRRLIASAPIEPMQSLQFGQLTIDAAARRITLRGKTIEISSSEFDLLWLLASRAGEVLRRDAVQIELRGFASDDSHRFVDARLYRLRKRLGNSPEVAARIRTVRPFGYLFAKVDW